MFSIVTTQKILEKLYSERSVWGDIIARTKCFYVKLDTEWWEEDDNALIELSNSQANIINGNDLFEEIEKHPEAIANYPTSVFILDIDENKARQLQEKYGVIIQAVSHLDDSILTSVLPRKTFSMEEGENAAFGWREIFSGVKDLPSNSIIINDRNLFTNDEIVKDKDGVIIDKHLLGVDSIFNILNEALPQKLDIPFHVLIVCDKTGIEGDGMRRRKSITVKNVITYLNGLKKHLNRPFPIVMELLAVCPGSSFFPATHNRRILTNYGLLTFEHKVNAFKGRMNNASQLISVNKLFSHENLKTENDPPFLFEHNRITKALHKYLSYLNTTTVFSEHEFAKNGKADLRFIETEHPMIIY